MSEEDYQTLKLQQGLLVDFSAFGQRFIDLLCACEKDEKSNTPKFQLQFYSKEPLPYDHGHANLNVIEINPFKHLCHLSLNFMPGNDTDVKKYLATCLQTLRDDHTKLVRLHEETKASQSQKYEATCESLHCKTQELEKLKLDLDSQSERMQTKHMQEINFERDKSMQNQYALQQKYEKEKKEFELHATKTQKSLEQRLAEFELDNKDLLEKKYKNESQLQEFRLKVTTLQEDNTTIKAELTQLRKQNCTLDSELHGTEKVTNQMRTKIAVLEQEVKDKLDTINKGQELLSSEQAQRKQLDEQFKEKVNELKKKQAEINHYVNEFKKGNEVVIKLQSREKSLVGQIKLKTRILTEQEKVMKEKEKEIDDLKSDCKDLRQQVANLSDENKELKSTLQKKTVELDEAAKLLKRDENIISWLNKQITDNKIGAGSNGNYDSSSHSGVVFKPFGALLPSNGNLSASSGLGNNLIESSLNTMRLNNQGGLASQNGNNQYLNKSNERLYLSNQNTNQPPQMSTYQTSYQHRSSALSSSSNSSLQHCSDSLKENQETIGSPTLTHRTTDGTGGSSSSRLDPKYFQSHTSSHQLSSLEVIPLKQQLNKQSSLTNTLTGANSVRLNNKQLVSNGTNGSVGAGNGGYTTNSHQPGGASIAQNGNVGGAGQYINNNAGLMSTKSTPSLASAYFPSN
jgi:spindle assembly abnormal protein 6